MAKKLKLSHVIILLLILLQTFLLLQISSLKTKLQQVEYQITLIENRTNQNMAAIYQNVDRKLEEYTSLVSSCKMQIGPLNLETLNVPITFQLQPKTITQNTQVFLDFENEKVPMEKSGTQFTLTKEFKINTQMVPTILIQEGATQQFETNLAFEIYNLQEQVFPRFAVRFEGQSGYDAQPPYNYQMQGVIVTKLSYAQANQDYKNAKYIVTLDNETIKTYDIEDVTDIYIQVKDTYKMQKGQTLVGKIVATNPSGFTYQQIIFQYAAGASAQTGQYGEIWSIIAPDGTVIYKMDENSYERIE